MIAPQCSTVCGLSGGGGGGGFSPSVAKLWNPSSQLIPGGGVATLVLLPAEYADVGPALTADEANSRIIVNQTGLYEVSHSMSWGGTADLSVEGGSSVIVNGTTLPDFGKVLPDLSEELSYSFSMLLALEAGDFLQLFASQNGVNPINIVGRLWVELVALT